MQFNVCAVGEPDAILVVGTYVSSNPLETFSMVCWSDEAWKLEGAYTFEDLVVSSKEEAATYATVFFGWEGFPEEEFSLTPARSQRI